MYSNYIYTVTLLNYILKIILEIVSVGTISTLISQYSTPTGVFNPILSEVKEVTDTELETFSARQAYKMMFVILY